MSTIAQIEDAMLAALREKLPGVEVDTLPGPPEEAARRTMRMPAVWVVWTGERPEGAPQRHGQGLRQTFIQSFVVAVVTRNLRSRKDGARGAYDLIDAVLDALLGLKVLGATGFLNYAGTRLFEIDTGVFVYFCTFEVQTAITTNAKEG